MAGLPDWRDRPLADLLATHGLTSLPETDFPTDGWSGATFSAIDRSDRRFILKRTSWDQDWIARATLDEGLREPWFAAVLGDAAGVGDAAASTADASSPIARRQPPVAYLGAARDDDGRAAILLPDLSDELIAWDRPGASPAVDQVVLERVLDGLARLHASGWAAELDAAVVAGDASATVPWTPWRERLTLLSRPRAAAFEAEGNRVGPIFLRGWEVVARRAPRSALDLLERLWSDPSPVLARLSTLPSVGLHADLKVANVALLAEDGLAFIDWQMAMRAPVAIELAWFLVANSAELPLPPPPILGTYRAAAERAAIAAGSSTARSGATDPRRRDPDEVLGDWLVQVDLVWILGLLLRGWRKGLDADAGIVLPSGLAAADDLQWWATQAVEAADRRL